MALGVWVIEMSVEQKERQGDLRGYSKRRKVQWEVAGPRSPTLSGRSWRSKTNIISDFFCLSFVFL